MVNHIIYMVHCDNLTLLLYLDLVLAISIFIISEHDAPRDLSGVFKLQYSNMIIKHLYIT